MFISLYFPLYGRPTAHNASTIAAIYNFVFTYVQCRVEEELDGIFPLSSHRLISLRIESAAIHSLFVRITATNQPS